MLQFSTLWNSHPTIKGDAPILSPAVYPNQCAINMHASLARAGADLKTFRGVRSWEKGKLKYALRAQELADWLATPFSHLPFGVKKYPGKDAFEKIAGQSGLIFLQNYWGPGHQGDHIDLWNGSRLTDWKSWARIHLHISWEGTWSDYRHAPSIWFWRLS